MNILFLDDEDFLFTLMERYVKMLNIGNLFCTTSPDEALDIIQRNPIDVLLIDYNIPDISDINKYVKSISKSIKIVIVSGDDKSFIESNIQFNYDFLKKPFILDDLKKILSN